MQSLSTASYATSKVSLTETGSPEQQPTSQTYPFRLPSYKASYLGRFHPYGRKSAHARHQSIDLMKTIDLRYEPEHAHRPSLALSIVTEEDEAEVLRFNTTSHITPVMEELVMDSTDPAKSHRVNEIVIDFVLYLRRFFSPRRSLKTA